MLSSIHPFGERSRNNRFWLTAGAHVVGSTLGGLALGAIIGGVAWSTTLLWARESWGRAVVVAVAAAVALLLEATGRERRLPTRSRQVNENWIQTYRGWVYGGGFGVELGFGISTIITTALVHLMLVAMVLTGSFWASVAIGTTFGFVRGATVLLAWKVDSPERLRSFHRRLDDLRVRSRQGAIAALGVTATLGTAGATIS